MTTPNPYPTPMIYNLANDHHAARFGLQPWERDYLLTRCFEDRNGQSPEGIGYHIQDGTTPGSLSWWVHGRYPDGSRVQASSTVMIQKDGSILQVIPEKDGPWTNGKVTAPAPGVTVVQSGLNPNLLSLTIEAELRAWEAMPEAMFRSIMWQTHDWMSRYPWLEPRDLFGHFQVDSVDRAQCGRYLPRVLDALAAAPAPTSPGYGHVVTFDRPIRVLVTAAAGVNVREWGDLDAAVLDAWPQNREFFASGYVYGDSVAGEDRWYIVTGTGRRIWSGATNKPMLNR